MERELGNGQVRRVLANAVMAVPKVLDGDRNSRCLQLDKRCRWSNPFFGTFYLVAPSFLFLHTNEEHLQVVPEDFAWLTWSSTPIANWRNRDVSV